jgi:hypothetical protein
MLAKIVQHNLWPIVRRSNPILKRAQFVYIICLCLPFCLCKHIMGIILEAKDENNTGLPFRLPSHSNHPAIRHFCSWRAKDEDTEFHQ